MSDAHTHAETLVEQDLQELLGGEKPPDLIDRTLARLASGERAVTAQPTRRPAARLFTLRRLAEAAVVVLAVGVIGWLATRPRPLPEAVTASTGAEYAVHDSHVVLTDGWLLLTEGSPEVRVGATRVHGLTGRAVVGQEAPVGAARDDLAVQFKLSETEVAMFTNPRRWFTAGGLALCLLSGTAMLNDHEVSAEEPAEKPPQEQVESPAPEEVAKVKERLGALTSGELRVMAKGQWGGWLQLDARQVAALGATIGDSLQRPSEAAAGWDHQNAFRLKMKQGGVMELAVYTHGNRVGIKLPGWQRWVDYDCDEKLRQSIWPTLLVATDGAYVKGMEVKRKWAGADSKIKEKGTEIITDQTAWAWLWEHHKAGGRLGGDLDIPAIDFERELVVAMFAGETWNSRGYYVYETLQGDTQWTIRVDEYTYQTMSMDGTGGGEKVTPYGIFVLPRVEQSIVVEENVQGLLGKPPRWLQVAARMALATDQPQPMIEYKPDRTIQGKWADVKAGDGAELSLFTTAVNENQWKNIQGLVNDATIDGLEPDFDTQIVVLAADLILDGIGSHRLQFVGRNDTRTVVRLIVPTVQTAGEPPRSSVLYSLWVLPKPKGALVIETPQYRRIDQPPYWNEEHTLK